MRRKWLILVLSILFLAGGLLSYQLLYGQVKEQVAEYWQLSNKWFSTPAPSVDVPHTGGESGENTAAAPVILAVLNPNEVATLAPREEAPRETPHPEPEIPQESAAPEESESPEALDTANPAKTPEATETPAEDNPTPSAAPEDTISPSEGTSAPSSAENAEDTSPEIAENTINPETPTTMDPQTLVKSTENNLNSTALEIPVEPTPAKPHGFAYLIFLTIAGIGIISLGIYLVEQHFMR